ncbi:uncharacterized protein LOC128256919 [Drosophila gunungcola]|uniref:uncharacterized protein LOC128256919 n=1 Tax=Drosophila gunungcola TaxID=103775 RepID=UPI0022E447B5|nr:uncharacterized protein LOC128256919 [Drosophila gunungcola]
MAPLNDVRNSILTAGNGNTPTHTQKDIQPCETGCHGIENGNPNGNRTMTCPEVGASFRFY